MRSDPPPLLPIFRSRHQAELLAYLFLHPELELPMKELADRVAVPLNTMHREVERLEQAGLLVSRTVGRSRLIRANARHRLSKPLTDLLQAAFGPRVVIGDEFIPIAGVEKVVIYGSWAARYSGASGPFPNDIDVLIIGMPEREDIYDAADRAQRRLGMPVNPVISSRARWESAKDALVREIQSSPRIELSADRDET